MLRCCGAIITERSISSFIYFFSTEEDCLKLLEIEHTITCLVMLSDHIVHFLAINLLTKLLHCKANVFFSDLSGRISIELVEDSLQSRLSQEVLYIDSGCQELTIVDLFVVVIIHLIDHFCDFSITYIHALLHENVVKFLRPDHSSTICIKGLELSPQILHLLLSGSLNEKVHGGLLES